MTPGADREARWGGWVGGRAVLHRTMSIILMDNPNPNPKVLEYDVS